MDDGADLYRNGRYGGETHSDHDGRNVDAAKDLNRAEEQALNNSDDAGWENKVTGASKNQKKRGRYDRSFIGFSRKYLPTIMIILMIFGAGTTIFGNTALQGMSLVSVFQQHDNTQAVVSKVRGMRLIQHFLGGKNKGSASAGTIFDAENFKLGNDQISFLHSSGIDVHDIELPDGSASRMLTFDDGETLHFIFGDDTSPHIDTDDIAKKLNVDTSTKKISAATKLSTAEADIPDFKNKLTAGTATITGQSSGWFDRLTNIFHNRKNVSRNTYAEYERTGDADVDRETALQIARDAEAKASVEGGTSIHGEKTETDEDGNTVKDSDGNPAHVDEKVEDESTNKINAGDSEDVIKTKLTSKAEATLKAAGIADIGAAGVNLACTTMSIAGMINDLAVAREKMQAVSFATKANESFHKDMAGDGKGSASSPILELMNKPDENGNTGMQAAGVVEKYGGTFDTSQEGIDTFNFENTTHELFSGSNIQIQSMSMDELRNCNYARLATNAVAAGIQIAADIVLFSVSGGIGNVIKSIAITAAAGAAISGTIALLVNFMVPKLAEIYARDLFTPETVKNHLTYGHGYAVGNAIQDYGNHQIAGGSGGDIAAVTAFNQTQQAVLAEQAEYERATRNPLDPTSQYTFLGTLYKNLLPVASSAGNVLSLFNNLASAASTSLASFLPAASALDPAKITVLEQGEDCPVSDDIGAASNHYCVPFIISDLSTASTPPGDIYETVLYLNDDPNGDRCPNFKNDGTCEGVQLDAAGNPEIQEGSELYKYIVFCGLRDTQYGVADANIASDLASTGNATLDKVVNGVANIDALGNIKDMYDAAVSEANSGWISGLYCLDTENNTRWENEMKYYQRYAEDQRLMVVMGVIDKSSVEVTIENYLEKHPTDNSYEGTLARYSGYTKEQILALEDLYDYYEFIAAYDPTGRAPLEAEDPENVIERLLFYIDDLALLQMQQPLVARTAELERQISLREHKRTVDQSI